MARMGIRNLLVTFVFASRSIPTWATTRANNAAVDELEIDHSAETTGVKQVKGWFRSRTEVKKLEVFERRSWKDIHSFMRHYGPIPFFPSESMGNLGEYWNGELDGLTDIARQTRQFGVLDEALKAAVRAIKGFKFRSLLTTIHKPRSGKRRKAAAIQRLLLALKMVRLRRNELTNTPPLLLNVFLNIIKEIPLMTPTDPTTSLFEWCNMVENEQAPVNGFGETIMTLFELGGRMTILGKLKSFKEKIVKGTEGKISAEVASQFVDDFNKCPFIILKERATTIADWLEYGADINSQTYPLRDCSSLSVPQSVGVTNTQYSSTGHRYHNNQPPQGMVQPRVMSNTDYGQHPPAVYGGHQSPSYGSLNAGVKGQHYRHNTFQQGLGEYPPVQQMGDYQQPFDRYGGY